MTGVLQETTDDTCGGDSGKGPVRGSAARVRVGRLFDSPCDLGQVTPHL